MVAFAEQCLNLHKLTDQTADESKELYEKCGGLILDISQAYSGDADLKNRLRSPIVVQLLTAINQLGDEESKALAQNCFEAINMIGSNSTS